MPTQFENPKEVQVKDETLDTAKEPGKKIDQIADKAADKANKRESDYDKNQHVIFNK